MRDNVWPLVVSNEESEWLSEFQLYELKWFCENVTGLHADFYKVMEQVETFNNRMERLEKTCTLIEAALAQPADGSENE